MYKKEKTIILRFLKEIGVYNQFFRNFNTEEAIEYRRDWLINHYKTFDDYLIYQMQTTSGRGFLVNAFRWHGSKEGQMYWVKKSRLWRKFCNEEFFEGNDICE